MPQLKLNDMFTLNKNFKLKLDVDKFNKVKHVTFRNTQTDAFTDFVVYTCYILSGKSFFKTPFKSPFRSVVRLSCTNNKAFCQMSLSTYKFLKLKPTIVDGSTMMIGDYQLVYTLTEGDTLLSLKVV